jgi:hypothetical protein
MPHWPGPPPPACCAAATPLSSQDQRSTPSGAPGSPRWQPPGHRRSGHGTPAPSDAQCAPAAGAAAQPDPHALPAPPDKHARLTRQRQFITHRHARPHRTPVRMRLRSRGGQLELAARSADRGAGGGPGRAKGDCIPAGDRNADYARLPVVNAWPSSASRMSLLGAPDRGRTGGELAAAVVLCSPHDPCSPVDWVPGAVITTVAVPTRAATR